MLPEHIGVVPAATGVAGVGLTVAVVVTGDPEHPAIVIVTVYTPELAAVAPGMLGFCKVDVNPPGPVQAYVAPAVVGVHVKFNVAPEQIGPLLPAVIAGTMVCKTTTVSVLFAVPQPEPPVIDA